MAWPKGTPRPPTSGRKKGSKNKRTLAIEEFARTVTEDTTVQAMVLKQAKSGTLSAPIFQMLFYYAYGKPAEHLNVDHSGTVNIVDRARAANTRIERLRRASQGTSQELREPTD